MSELRELYQEVILDHYRKPRNSSALREPSHRAEGINPLCGDKVQISLRIDDGRVTEIAFEGAGCAISTASASLMTEAVKGKTVEEAEEIFRRFHEAMTGEESFPGELGKLEVLSGVREYPVRIKCATLAWHTLHAALHEQETQVSTE